MSKRRVYRGFSLIEVIVSSALVASTVGALFSAAALSTRLTVLGQERVVASQLAREGLEIAKNIRDQNYIDQTCATDECAKWTYGLLTEQDLVTLADRAVTKRVEFSSTGHALKTEDIAGKTCTDYISRETMLPDANLDDNPDQIFCRRIFIELINDSGPEGNFTKESGHWLRVRSQVSWVGHGRNTLRNFAGGGVKDTNPCQPDGDEWCTEQVTVLTDWRASND